MDPAVREIRQIQRWRIILSIPGPELLHSVNSHPVYLCGVLGSFSTSHGRHIHTTCGQFHHSKLSANIPSPFAARHILKITKSDTHIQWHSCKSQLVPSS